MARRRELAVRTRWRGTWRSSVPQEPGFYVCVADLEDELIRAIGTGQLQELIDSKGDLGSLRSLQRQPQWRGRPLAAQLQRFLGSGARRKLRYARLLAGAVDASLLPHPLDGLLTRISQWE